MKNGKGKKILFAIGLVMLFALSIVVLLNKVFNMVYEQAEVVEVDINELTTDYGGEIVLGDVSGSKIVTVKSYPVSTTTRYECSACTGYNCSSDEAAKDASGKYKASGCSSCSGSCYKNTYTTYSNKATLSYKITTGNWLISEGDSVSCNASCSLDPSKTSSTCSISGPCSSGSLSIPEKTASYTNSVLVDGTTYASGTLNVKYCSPTWGAGKSTKFFKTVWDRDTAIKNGEKVYMDGCEPLNCNKEGVCGIYKCGPGHWFSRCGYNVPGVSVCVYTPSGIGDNSYKYANSYKMTNSPTESELNYVALDKNTDTCKGCFGNTPTFARATVTSWSTGPSSATPYKYDEKTSAAACNPLPEPRVCAPQDYTDGRVEEETEKCEEEKSIFYEDGKKCVSSTDDAFYEIKCVNKIANLFDLDRDDIEVEVLDIKQGQSFGYEIKSTSTKLCYAKFNAEVWKRAYNRIQAKFEALENESVRVSASEKASATQWYITVQSKIFKQISDYLEWKPLMENEPGARVTLSDGNSLQALNNPKGNTPANKVVILEIDDDKTVKAVYQKNATNENDIVGVYQQYKADFEKDYKGNHIMITNSSGNKVPLDVARDYGINITGVEAQPNFNINLSSGRYVNESMPSPAINLSNVKNYLWTTSTKNEIVIIPPEVTLDWINGAIVGSGITARIEANGYNRIYTDSNIAKNKVYTLNVTLDNLGTNNSEVKDNKCKLRVLGRDFIYRVIEESNPFINNTRQKGYNWYRTGIDGTLYDFTQIIPTSNEFSKKYDLTPEDIRMIKESNASITDAYLGACYIGVNDSASKILCN